MKRFMCIMCASLMQSYYFFSIRQLIVPQKSRNKEQQ